MRKILTIGMVLVLLGVDNASAVPLYNRVGYTDIARRRTSPSSSSSTSSSSKKDPFLKMNTLFGVRNGSKVSDFSFRPDPKVVGVYYFTPSQKNGISFLDSYSVSVTPVTRVIYSIKGKSYKKVDSDKLKKLWDDIGDFYGFDPRSRPAYRAVFNGGNGFRKIEMTTHYGVGLDIELLDREYELVAKKEKESADEREVERKWQKTVSDWQRECDQKIYPTLKNFIGKQLGGKLKGDEVEDPSLPGELYKFVPVSQLYGEMEYRLLVTPTSKRIYWIGAYATQPKKESSRFLEEAVVKDFGEDWLRFKYSGGNYYLEGWKGDVRRRIDVGANKDYCWVSLLDEAGMKVAEKESSKCKRIKIASGVEIPDVCNASIVPLIEAELRNLPQETRVPVTGLFGFKLGEVLDDTEVVRRKEQMCLVQPKIEVKGFDSYRAYRNVKTKEIYELSMSTVCDNKYFQQSRVTEVKSMLELKYGIEFKKKESSVTTTYEAFTTSGQAIRIYKCSDGEVCVDVSDDELLVRAKRDEARNTFDGL